MRLVTFPVRAGRTSRRRAGRGRLARDRPAGGARARYGGRRSAQSGRACSRLRTGGADALDARASLVEAGAARGLGAALARGGEAARADPAPPQMRDFLCFEKHLVQAFQAARKVRAAQAPDPEAALREMEAKGILAIPQVWYERPVYYKGNWFSVVGHGADVHWPSYSPALDYELEIGWCSGAAARTSRASAPVARVRLHDLQRLLRARRAVHRDAGNARPGEGQGLRHRQLVRAVDHDRRRGRRPVQLHDDRCG